MPRRRHKDDSVLAEILWEILTIAPWWVGPILAAAAAGGMWLWMPPLAKWVFVIFLGLWGAAEFHKWQRRDLLESRRNIDSLKGITWQEFEQLVGEAYRRQGYRVTETGGDGVGDGGVDLMLKNGHETVLVQCKQWKNRSVGVKVVRELLGVVTHQRADRGIIVICGKYTQEAVRLAETNPIELVDGPRLWALIRDVQRRPTPQPADIPSIMRLAAPIGPNESGFERADRSPAQGARAQPGIPVPGAGFAPSPGSMPRGTGAPPPAQAPSTDTRVEQVCPICDSPMVLRTARRGANTGSKFWGCPNYPRCKGVRKL